MDDISTQEVKRSLERWKDIPEEEFIVMDKNTDPTYDFVEQTMLLSFNYTPTAEMYLNETTHINYIHGSLDKPKEMIFGYGDEMDKDFQALIDRDENALLDNSKSIKYLETSHYRDLLSFIEGGPFQVYIMGHSCGNSDRTLLNTIFEHENCISIKPFCYFNEKGEDNYSELTRNIYRNFTKAIMYKSVPKDLSKFDMNKFDMIVLFSPIGVRSLLESYPDFKENCKTIVAAFGTSTHAALNNAEIKITVAAPTKNAPSMATAIENFILGKELGAVIVSKPTSLKKNGLKKNNTKKTKSVFTNKSKYKQLLEEKKAAAAARRKERQAEKARKEAELKAASAIESTTAPVKVRASKSDTPSAEK